MEDSWFISSGLFFSRVVAQHHRTWLSLELIETSNEQNPVTRAKSERKNDGHFVDKYSLLRGPSQPDRRLGPSNGVGRGNIPTTGPVFYGQRAGSLRRPPGAKTDGTTQRHQFLDAIGRRTGHWLLHWRRGARSGSGQHQPALLLVPP